MNHEFSDPEVAMETAETLLNAWFFSSVLAADGTAAAQRAEKLRMFAHLQANIAANRLFHGTLARWRQGGVAARRVEPSKRKIKDIKEPWVIHLQEGPAQRNEHV